MYSMCNVLIVSYIVKVRQRSEAQHACYCVNLSKMSLSCNLKQQRYVRGGKCCLNNGEAEAHSLNTSPSITHIVCDGFEKLFCLQSFPCNLAASLLSCV